MNPLQALSTGMRLSLMSGINLYGTMAVTGLAIRFHWISEYPVGLEIYSSWPIIILAGVFYLVEFLADKIPWIDSIWDSLESIAAYRESR